MTDVKIAIVGDSGVGKTCVATRFVSNVFQQNVMSTSGAAFLRKTLIIANKPIRIQIWDTAGQEKFRSLTPMYYRSAHVCFVVFDVGRRTSLEDAGFWLGELRAKGAPGVTIAVIANKIDSDRRAISREEGQKWADDHRSLYFEVSAKTGEGVEEAFTKAVTAKLEAGDTEKPSEIIAEEVASVQKKQGCC